MFCYNGPRLSDTNSDIWECAATSTKVRVIVTSTKSDSALRIPHSAAQPARRLFPVMKTTTQERASKPDDDSSGVSSLHRRFLANAKQVQAQDAEIQRLQHQTQEQQQRIEELEAQVLQPNKAPDEEHDKQLARLRSELADRDRLLQEQDVDMDQATQTITMLMQQVQALQQVAARAEQAQRDAEADQMLRHVLREDDNGEVDAEVVQQLRIELQSAVQAQQQSSRIECELEEERVWLKETAEMLNSELQDLKEANREMLVKTESEQEVFREMEMAKAKADKEIDRLKAMDRVREEMLAVMQAQVKTMHADNQKLKHAITCCQQSADRQFQVLEKSRQSIDTENSQLRLELSSLKQDFTHLSNKLRDIQNKEFDVASDNEEGLEVDVHQTDEYAAQVHSAATPVVKLERTLAAASSHTTLDRTQEHFQQQGTNNNLEGDQAKSVTPSVLVKQLELLVSAQLECLIARRDRLRAGDDESSVSSSDYDEGADADNAACLD